MPKGHKRKNTGVGVDFKRAKHKVGKKLPKAQNTTETDVRSRAISMPEQSIATDKSGHAVTNRNLTLKDVLGQCGHYSERVRLDALHGLAELLRTNPELAGIHGAAIVATASDRAVDADAACRAALKDLFQKSLLPALGRDALQPFMPVLMGHVCRAMTHLAEPIRVDALSLLAVLMDWRADLIAAGYLPQVLAHFADALARPTRGRSLKAGSLQALLAHVAGLQSFLAKATAALSGVDASQAAPSLLLGDADDSAQHGVLMWRRCSWPQAVHLQDAAAAADADFENAQKMLLLLLDCWRECSPGELETQADLLQAKCATAVLQCCSMLVGRWGVRLTGTLTARTSPAHLIAERVAVFFPFHDPVVPVPTAVRDQLVQLNVAAAQLLVALLPGAIQQATPPQWALRLLSWLTELMASGHALPAAEGALGAGAPGQQQQQRRQPSTGSKSVKVQKKNEDRSGPANVPAAVYSAALDAMSDILPHLPPLLRRQALGSVWALWQRTPVRSAARSRALAFFAALLARPAALLYAPLPPTGEPLVLQEEAAAWVGAMPRFLWELGTAAPATTAAALQLMLDAARFCPAAGAATPGPMQNVLATLQGQLAPLFAVEVGAGNTKKGSSTGSKLVAGPLAGMPQQTQALAADVLFHLPGLPEPTLKVAGYVALAFSSGTCACYPLATAIRLVDLASMKATDADPGQLWGLLLALLAGRRRDAAGAAGSPGGEESDAWARHVAVVDATCKAALSAADGRAAVDALGPSLLSAGVNDAEPARRLFGLLSLCLAAAESEMPEGGWMPSDQVWGALPGAVLALLDDACTVEEGGCATVEETAAMTERLLAACPALMPSMMAALSAHTTNPRAAIVLLITLLKSTNPLVETALIHDAAAVEAAVAASTAAAAKVEDSALRTQVLEMQTLVSQKLGGAAP